jgi:hypothetical protein
MGQDAECYQKMVDDRTIILNPRSWYFHPFLAGSWTDLRLGFFLSLTDAVNDDLTEGSAGAPGDLAETITNPSVLNSWDRYSIGVLDTVRGETFLGFTNMGQKYPDANGDSILVSSDGAVGTTNTNFWRPSNSQNNTWSAAILDKAINRTVPLDNLQQHFPQNAATVAAGYAVLLALQLLRDKPDSLTIRMMIKSTTKSADWIYSNTPTKELIRQTMASWPPSQQMGPVTVSNMPSAFWFYWPFRKSRLRVHSLGLLRGA